MSGFLIGPMGVAPAASGGGGSLVYVAGSSVAIQHPNFGGSTATFTGLNGGVNFPNGALVVVFFTGDQPATTLTTPLIGGQAATVIAGATSSNKQIQAFQAVMSGSNADTFSFGNGNGFANIGIASCYITGANSTATASGVGVYNNDAQPLPLAAPIAVPASGVGVVFGSGNGGSLTGANTVTWTNTTVAAGDVNSGPTFTQQVSLASIIGVTASWDPRLSGNSVSFNFQGGVAAVAYGP